MVLDVDDDGECLALTDAVLMMRWLFGFTGAGLVDGAVDSDCKRCSASKIEGYLEGVAGAFDIDGDGELEGLTDGLLALRWLFGFRGELLIGGVVDADCTRCSWTTIESYLDGLD